MQNELTSGSFRRCGMLILAGMLCLGTMLHAQTIEKITAPVVSGAHMLKYPFAGGLDAPQFSAVDFNRDGLQDVFVFDRQGGTAIPFVTVGEEGNYSYQIQWDALDYFPHLSQWVLLLDFNGDGVEDIFASTSEPGIQGIDVYRGRVVGDKLAFTKMTFDIGDYDLLYFKLDQGYTPIYSAWIDVPVIKDVDGDGDVDILTFEPGGSYVHFLKNTAVENGLGLDTFRFEWADACWGKFAENAFNSEIMLSESPGQCASPNIMPWVTPRHSGSAMAAYDLEGDGDQDLFIGDLASPRITKVINGGTASQAWMTDQETLFPSNDVSVNIPFFVAPFILDINHDGHPDFIAASNNTGFSENVQVAWYYSNDGADNFHLEDTGLFVSEMLDFGSEAKPTFFDYNADGLPDILIGTGGYYTPSGTRDARLVLLKNTGTETAPAFEVIDDDYLGFSQYASVPTWEFAPTAGDLDNDGDIDLIVGERNGGLFFVENTAGPGVPAVFATPVYPFAGINVGTSSTPALVDLNGDGLLDIVCGERIGNNNNEGRCSNLNYFQNTGSPGNPQFSADLNQPPNTACLGHVLFGSLAGIPEFSAPAYARTPDGLRMLAGSSTGQMRLYGGIEGVFDGPYILEDDDYGGISDGGKTVPSLADIDADGYYEMVLGNQRGGITLYNTDLQVFSTGVTSADNFAIPVQLLPNPSNGEVILRVNDGVAGSEVQVAIYDVLGRVLQSYAHLRDGDRLTLPSFDGVAFAVLTPEYATHPVVLKVCRY